VTRRLVTGLALLLALALVLGLTVAWGSRDHMARRRLLGRAAAALERSDLASLVAVERELDALYREREARLTRRRDGIRNELGAARDRVRAEIARAQGVAEVTSLGR
jgi:hypothetical protein